MAEFEWFKHEARHGAYTCRLPSCPNASIGFENDIALAQHESKHSAHMCSFSGCQYPPFDTLKSLTHHIKKQHETPAPPKMERQSIRSRVLGSSGSQHAFQTNTHLTHGSRIARNIVSVDASGQQHADRGQRGDYVLPSLVFNIPRQSAAEQISSSTELHGLENIGKDRPEMETPNREDRAEPIPTNSLPSYEETLVQRIDNALRIGQGYLENPTWQDELFIAERGFNVTRL